MNTRLHRKYKVLIITIVTLVMVALILHKENMDQLRISKTREILQGLGSRNTSELVNVDKSTVVIHSESCKPAYVKLLAVVVVISRPEDTKNRNKIRKNWSGWTVELKNVKLIFFVGLGKDFDNIVEESDLHDDIVMDAIEENYYSLTLKSLRILKWFSTSCSNAKYLVKSDMDTFIHVPNLINYLNSVNRGGPHVADKFIGGEISVQAYPVLDPRNKCFMPEELLKSVHLDSSSPFPNYVKGGFYVISSALIPTLLSESLKVPLIQFEDIFLTGIVANKRLGITLTKIPGVFSRYLFGLSIMRRSCLEPSTIAYHSLGDFNSMALCYGQHQQVYGGLKFEI